MADLNPHVNDNMETVTVPSENPIMAVVTKLKTPVFWGVIGFLACKWMDRKKG